MIDFAIFGAFLVIAGSAKDKIVAGIAALYAIIHFYGIYYHSITWVDLCFEAALCAFLGGIILSQSVRTWAVYLTSLLIISIVLISVEFVDYFCCNSYLTKTYEVWIYITTGLELLILTLARNGFLHSYTDHLHDFWTDIHYRLRHYVNKVSL